MKIIGLETVQIGEFSNLVWVRLHTDEGLIGLGETFRNPEAVTAYLHETCAPFLLGRDPTNRAALTHALRHDVGNHFNGFPGRSVEIRGNSAVDIALWDLGGQMLGQPLYALLGGKQRDAVRIYNTCANAAYNNLSRPEQNQQVFSRRDPAPAAIGPDEDLLMQVHEPARLAEELLAQGISAMKIWPFDVAALRNRGLTISPAEIKEALWPIERIRDAVGNSMEIMIELHGLWSLPPALEIARALEDFSIYWLEDPIGLHNLSDLAVYRNAVRARVAASENLGSLAWYREVLPRGAIDVATFDMAWVGGFSEGLKVTHLAQAFDRAIAPHDCTGPVTLICNVHLLAHAENGLIAETVRSHMNGFYSQVMSELPSVKDGFIHPLEGAGLGAHLVPAALSRSDVATRVTGKIAH